jgi:hypothetical protein
MTATIAGREYHVAAEDVQRVARQLDPEPIDVWFTMVDQRRFPPKQLVEALTGLDRADFNSHQARALLVRLGFPVERRRARVWRVPGTPAEVGSTSSEP